MYTEGKNIPQLNMRMEDKIQGGRKEGRKDSQTSP